LTESWDQLACDYNDADPTKVMDKLLTHLSMGALAGVKAKLLRKLEEGGGNAQKRYADLGLIFSETRFVIKDLLKGAAPDSDWVESTTDLAKRLASVLG
jgi:hypothetical protein